MINIAFNLKDNFINKIKITGHSDSSEFGKDIICASISSLTLNIINALEEYVNIKTNAKLESGYTYFEIPKGNETQNVQSDALAKAFLMSVEGLEDEYPNFIKVKITEE